MLELTPSEWKTRKARIDPRLATAGWPDLAFAPGQPAPPSPHGVTEYPTANGPADYALCLDGKVLAVVEAKRVNVGPQEVLAQAERYARGLTASPFDFNGLRVPFLYSTNGEVIWFRDARHPLNLQRRVTRFHTPAALAELLVRDSGDACPWFLEHPNTHPRLRPYQVEANTAVEQALAARKRHMLIAMATGTGKTFTMVNQVYRLMKSGMGKRNLFLVDRRALAAQAVRAFASFEAERGLKFDQVYEVYSQRFQREDLDSLDDADELPEPEELATDAIGELEAAMEELNQVLALLEDDSGIPGRLAAAGHPE
jgi:type I restriction enzyme R subunit